MRTVIVTTLALALATPASAQDGDGSVGGGLDLLGEGSRMILDGLMEDMRPMLDEVRPFLEEEVVPLLERMGDLVDDLSHYELPERLPNGDIIIRRSEDAPPLDPDPAPEPGTGALEL